MSKFKDYSIEWDKEHEEYIDSLERLNRPSTKTIEHKEENFKYAGQFLLGVLENLYGDKPLDQADLEHCLEELACYLDVDMKPYSGAMTIQRKSDVLSALRMFSDEYHARLTTI